MAVKAAAGLDVPASEHNATAAANAVRVVRLQPEHSVLIEAHETRTTEAATLRARINELVASVAQLTHSLSEQAIEAAGGKTAHSHAQPRIPS